MPCQDSRSLFFHVLLLFLHVSPLGVVLDVSLGLISGIVLLLQQLATTVVVMPVATCPDMTMENFHRVL